MPKQFNLFKLFKRKEIYHAYISFIFQGQRIQLRETTGTRNKQEAEQYCLDRIKNFQLNNSKNISLDQLFGKYYEEYGKYQAYPNNLKFRLKNLLYGIGDILLTNITSNTISNYIYLRKQIVKNGTINRELSDLNSIFNIAKDKWDINVPNIKLSKFKLKEPAENIKYLKNWQELQMIIDNASPHLKPIIYTAIYTGLRLGNILNLKWENIDFDNKLITIYVKDKNKDGGKIHTLPIIDKLHYILKAIPKKGNYVFLFRNKPIKSIKTSWHNCFKGNMKYINFHTLRHTCATWLLKETNNLKIVKEILGHADIKTTLKYSHILNKDKINALKTTFENL